MTASEKIHHYVEITREGADRAEKDYDAAAAEIKRKSSHSIDLFGGNATSQVADIAAMSRKACETLYATYQTLIRMLDENCRPLLEEAPSAESVKEAADLISWLNKESEIENNFTASLNSSSLGGLASVRFFPTVENKMVEKFWEQKYREMPDWAENERRIREKKEAEEQARLKRMEEGKTLAEKWEAEKKERNERYQKVLDAYNSRKKAFRDELDQYIEKERESMAADLEKQKAAAEASLAKLSIFHMSEKKQLNSYIKEITDRITALNSAGPADESVKELKRKAEDAFKEYEKQMDEYLIKRFPYDKSLFKKRLQSITGEKRAILDVLEDIGAGTIDDIMKAGKFDMSPARCSAVARQLVESGIVRREEIRRIAYFTIADQDEEQVSRRNLLSSVIDGFYEDTAVADDSMPVAPDVEKVMKE